MNIVTAFETLTWIDGLLVMAYLVIWQALSWFIEHPTQSRPSVTVLMSDYRRQWMQVMVTRQPRIFDAQVMMSLRQGTAFFASTCLLALGGLLALIGNVDPLRGLAAGIGQGAAPTVVLQLKLVLVLVLLGNAFLKFVWANRVFGYCSVMMGAVPNDANDPSAAGLARKAAELNIRAAMNFNRGLRAMYFALGALAWLVGPIGLVVALVMVSWLVWSREFASIPREIVLSNTDT